MDNDDVLDVYDLMGFNDYEDNDRKGSCDNFILIYQVYIQEERIKASKQKALREWIKNHA